MSETLSALDATFLELEQENDAALMSIGGVMVFDPLPGGGAPTVEELAASLIPRLARLPRYFQKLSSPRTGRFAWPHWIWDERFDIRDHIVHVGLPAPGGEAELCEWAADFYSHRLDRSRPLWEMALVEGLPDGRWALAHKTHHCLVDGVGSVDVAQVLLDAEPNPAERPPASGPPSDESRLRGRIPAPDPVVQAAQAGWHAAQAGLHAARHPREALARSGALVEVLVRDELVAAPRTSLNVPIGSTRRFAAVTARLAELKQIRSALGGSVNDVALAACTSGLRELLLARAEKPPVQGLRAMVPVNIRASSESLALGNRVSSLFVELPVAEASARERHRQIVRTTTRLKHSGAAAGGSAMVELTALAPPVLHTVLARALFATRLFNVTITNVPGPQIPLYAMGAALREVYPVVPLAAEHGVGVAIFSYNGGVTFGVIADSESTPDIAVLARGIAEGIEELLDMAGDRTRAERTPVAVASRKDRPAVISHGA